MTGSRKMQCPSCKSTLSTIQYEGIQIESCDACQGEWLDAGELKHIVQVRETRFDEQERRAVAAAVKITGVDVEQADRDLVCPKCTDRTNAINYGGDTGIVIDKCQGCGGVWLDGGEMENIQKVVEGWEDGLPADLKQYGARLRQVADDVKAGGKVKISRIGFVNSIINGILDIGS